MTEEQIKQNAEAYVSNLILSEQEEENYELTFIDGAHSRDEEIEELKKLLFEKECDIQFLEHKLRNPWISVEDRLPETGADIVYLMNSGTPGRNERYRKFDTEWFRMNVRHWQYANDPKLKKGE